MGIIEPILKALTQEGYKQPTPIQAQAIPVVLTGRDLLGVAQTGTGKTAAFAIPMLQLLAGRETAAHPRPIRALILTPTRELAIQVDESFGAYGRNLSLRHEVIFGGVGQTPQTNALRKGVDILTATPGRLLDLMNQGFVQLDRLEIFVLDEADRMLDMGFIHDVKKVIAKLPRERQSLFFSATMPPEIVKLASTIVRDPYKVEVTPSATTVEKVSQSVFYVSKNEKRALILHILQDSSITRALVFTRTKHGANKLAKDLVKAGITAEAIHGNKSQTARQEALRNFKSSATRILVATDIAARGIDVDELTHVINYEIPNVPETYVHRIGRTGRAGASGTAISFCDAEEKVFMKDIERTIGMSVPVRQVPPEFMKVLESLPTPEPGEERPARQPQQRRQGQPGQRRSSGTPGERRQGERRSGEQRQGQSGQSQGQRRGEKPAGGAQEQARRRDGEARPARAGSNAGQAGPKKRYGGGGKGGYKGRKPQRTGEASAQAKPAPDPKKTTLWKRLFGG